MSGGAMALLELLLVFGAVLAFGLWELRQLRRDKRPPPSPEGGREPD
jgi:hypothetical protein